MYIYILYVQTAAVLLTPCGSAGRGKPKTKSKQRTRKTERRTAETDKLEVGTGNWEVGGKGRTSFSLHSGHCVCHLAVALHSIWGQLGKVFAVCAGADRRHKKSTAKGGGRWKEFIPSLCCGGRCARKKGTLLSCFVPNL